MIFQWLGLARAFGYKVYITELQAKIAKAMRAVTWPGQANYVKQD